MWGLVVYYILGKLPRRKGRENRQGAGESLPFAIAAADKVGECPLWGRGRRTPPLGDGSLMNAWGKRGKKLSAFSVKRIKAEWLPTDSMF